jgi:uncharacterized membrane protein YfcA
MHNYLIIIAVGAAAGFFSGQFGVGGAFLMQPALRLLLHAPKLVAIGTPIGVIVVSSFTGALNYYRSGYVDTRIAIYLALSGSLGAIFGSLATSVINGSFLLISTAVILAATSVRFILADRRGNGGNDGDSVAVDSDVANAVATNRPVNKAVALSVGAVVGFLTGLLGLGGGYILIPTLTLVFERDIKTAIGTSLFVIIAYAIPGAVTHLALGHVDVMIVFLLVLGVIPGAYFGSKVAIGLPEKVLRSAFGIFLFVVSIYFGISEVKNLIGK